MDSLIKEHGPAGLLIAALVLTGSLVNNVDNKDDKSIKVHSHWCKQLNHSNLAMPNGITQVAIAASIILPLIPVFINSRFTWNNEKTEIVKSHLVGQSASYGIAELSRHFIVFPEPAFFTKCNLTYAECKLKAQLNLPQYLSKINLTHALCPNSSSTTSAFELFDSLHHFPDKVCVLLGAGIISFVAAILHWHSINKSGKSVFDLPGPTKVFLVSAQILFAVVTLLYLFFLYKTLESANFVGLIVGATLQGIIVLSMLRKDQDQDK